MIDLNNILGDGIGNMQLIQQVGDDKMIVNAARVSYGQDTEGELTARDAKLIRRLVRDHHTSPFEHNLLTVKVRLPLNIGEQWLRHRIGWSYNKQSGRYIDMTDPVFQPEFYIPVKFRQQSQTNHQGSVDGAFSKQENEVFGMLEANLFKKCVDLYNDLVEQGVAKEQARMVLPQALYMSMYVTCNLASLMHFVHLRSHENAQWEMQQYAMALLQIAKEFWPYSITALEKNYE